jgi:hypothetical protein
MNTFGILGVFFIVLLIIVWPLAIIWAVNTLFGLGIAYTFWNWLAVVILYGMFGRSNISIK